MYIVSSVFSYHTLFLIKLLHILCQFFKQLNRLDVYNMQTVIIKTPKTMNW